MNRMHDQLNPSTIHGAAALSLPGGGLLRQCWQAGRWLVAWRPVVAAETLIVCASLAFSVFYNHAFWQALFG